MVLVQRFEVLALLLSCGYYKREQVTRRQPSLILNVKYQCSKWLRNSRPQVANWLGIGAGEVT